jgi:hypothetical protein
VCTVGTEVSEATTAITLTRKQMLVLFSLIKAANKVKPKLAAKQELQEVADILEHSLTMLIAS